MKKILFFFLTALSTLGLYQAEAFKGCENQKMNELCLSNVVDRCYTCVNTEHTKFIRPPVCVPIFHDHLGALENFPSNNWNCTVFRPEMNKDTDSTHEVEVKIPKEVCAIDEFIVDMCHDSDENGFCMIASYIRDICSNQEEGDEHTFSPQKYVSPWGPKSQCSETFYSDDICKSSYVKYCQDCRIPTMKINNVQQYYYSCWPVYEQKDQDRWDGMFKMKNPECTRWANNNYNPSSFHVESIDSETELTNYETKDAFRPACFGAICQKEGWTWKKTAYGKDWCGTGTCIPFGKTMFVCNYPLNCKGKKSTSLEEHESFEDLLNAHEFHTMGCGKEKFKCLLNKECRNLVKSLEDCKEEFGCVYQVVSTADNEQFIKLANCMFHN